jgi:hypothetical protein
MTRRFQIITLCVLFVLTLIIWFGLLGLAPILLLGWAVVGLGNEQFASQPLLWQLWPLLLIPLIFLILGALWWGMVAWIRRL